MKQKLRKKELQEILNKEGNLQNRINTFRKIFETNKTLDEFDREIFESVIEEVIIGTEEKGEISTNTITFIFRTGLEVKKVVEAKICISIPHTTHVETVVLIEKE